MAVVKIVLGGYMTILEELQSSPPQEELFYPRGSMYAIITYMNGWFVWNMYIDKYTICGSDKYQPCTLISLSQSDTESNQVSRLLLSLLLLLFFFFFFFLCFFFFFFFFFFFLCEVKFTIVSCRMPSQQKCQNRRIARRMLVQKQDAWWMLLKLRSLYKSV